MIQYHYGTIYFLKFANELCNVILNDTVQTQTLADGISYLKQGKSLNYGETEVVHYKLNGELFGPVVSGDTPGPVWVTQNTLVVTDEPPSEHFDFNKSVWIAGVGYPPFEIWPTFQPGSGQWIYYWYIHGSCYYRPGRDKSARVNFNSMQVYRCRPYGISPSTPLMRWWGGQSVSLPNRFTSLGMTSFPDEWTVEDWLRFCIEDKRVTYVKPKFSNIAMDLLSVRLQNKPVHLPLEYFLFCRDTLMADTEFIREKNYVLSDISQSIADQSDDLDINSIAYAKEALDYIRSFLHVATSGVDLSLLRDALAGDTLSVAKLTANGALSGSYGLNLTIRDTQDLVDFLTRKNDYPIRISRSSGSVKTQGHGISLKADYHIKCRYATTDHGIRGVLNTLYHTDLFPSSTNLWDLVPYSFCVDWIFPVDDVLESLDQEARLSVLPVKQVLRSDKITLSFSSTWCATVLGCTGSLTFTTYERRQSDTLPPIYPRFTGLSQFNSWVQAGALIIQRL